MLNETYFFIYKVLNTSNHELFVLHVPLLVYQVVVMNSLSSSSWNRRLHDGRAHYISSLEIREMSSASRLCLCHRKKYLEQVTISEVANKGIITAFFESSLLYFVIGHLFHMCNSPSLI